MCGINPFWMDTAINGSDKFCNLESAIMLWLVLVALLLLWLVGFYGGFVTTGLIHILLVAAVVILALNLLRQYRNPV